MALIGNYSVLNKTCGRFTNGTATAGAYVANTKSNWNSAWLSRSFAFQDSTEPTPVDTETFSYPAGYNLHEALIPSVKKTKIDLATTNQINGVGSAIATAILAKLSEATLSGSGDITSAQLASLIRIATALEGTSTVTAAISILTNMSTALSGVGTVSASLKSQINIFANLSGSGTISSSSNLKGRNSMSATVQIGGTGYLSQVDIQNLANAVWNELIANHLSPGSAGEFLNGAGGGSSPSAIADAVWDELLSGHVISGSAGEYLAGAGGGSSPSVIADAVRTELATELARIDVAVSTRSTPTNITDAQTALTTEINANETKIDTLQTSVNGKPNLAAIEGSTVLAKEATSQTIIANQSDIIAEIGNITPGSDSAHFGADAFVLTTGTVASGTYLDTRTYDEGEHHINASGGVVDFYYDFNIGTSYTPTTFQFLGHALTQNDTVSVYARDWDGATWNKIGEVTGFKLNNNLSFGLFIKHISVSGVVRIRFQSAVVSEVHLDMIYVGALAKAPTASEIATAVDGSTILAKETTVAAVSTKLGTPAGASVSADIATRASQSSVDGKPNLAAIEGSSVLAKTSDVTSAQSAIVGEVNANETKIDILQTAVNSKPNLAAIEGSSVLAKESSVSAINTKLGTPSGASVSADISTRASQSSVNSIPTNPLLTNDARLNNLDATISSRLSSIDTAAIATAVWSAATRSLNTDVTLGTSEINEIATAIQAAIINEGDGQMVIDAIVQAIGNENVTAATIASAVRSELATELARVDVAISTRLATSGYTSPPSVASIADGVWDEAIAGHLTAGSTGNVLSNSGGGATPPTAAEIADEVRVELATELARIDATVSSRATQVSVDGKPNLAAIEGSSVLAKESTVASKASQSSVNSIPTNPLLTNDVRLNNLDATVSSRSSQSSVNSIPTNPLLTNDSRLNNLDATVSSRSTPAQVNTEVSSVLNSYDPPTKAEMDSAFAQVVINVWNNVTRSLTADVTLGSSEITEIANAVQAAIINEGDGQQVIDAIVQAINNSGITAPLIGDAVRTELATELARIDVSMSSRASQGSVYGLY